MLSFLKVSESTPLLLSGRRGGRRSLIGSPLSDVRRVVRCGVQLCVQCCAQGRADAGTSAYFLPSLPHIRTQKKLRSSKTLWGNRNEGPTGTFVASVTPRTITDTKTDGLSHVQTGEQDKGAKPNTIVRSKGSQGSCGHRAVVVHAALNPSPRKRRPEEREGMGDEWERGGGVTGRYWTEVSRRVAASV
eukprot:scaffold19985_cov115-Isochrysis_galbana.AAC.4